MPLFPTHDLFDTSLPGSAYGYSGTRIDRLGAAEFTLVALAADASGSVAPFRTQIERCIQETVLACRQAPRADNLLLRLVQFDSRLDELHGFRPLMDCAPDRYLGCLSPGGCTALYDAAHNAVASVTSYGRDLVERGLSANAIVFVVTDGEDNRSHMTPGTVRQAVEDAVGSEHLESVLTVLVGVNVREPHLAAALLAFSTEAAFDHYLELDDADASTLARLADFLSRSIRAQSQVLGTGGPSQVLAF